MSKEIKIIQCARCKRELYRQETGDIKNIKGILGSNMQRYYISSDNCPECSKGAKNENNH